MKPNEIPEEELRGMLVSAWKTEGYPMILLESPPSYIDLVRSFSIRAKYYHLQKESKISKSFCDPVDDMLFNYISTGADRVLSLFDVGTADGIRIKKYSAQSFISGVRAVDLSPAMVQIARENGIDASVGSFKDITGEPDIVTALFSVLGTLKENELENAFIDVYKALPIGGRFCFDVTAGDVGFPADMYMDGKNPYGVFFTPIEFGGKMKRTRPDMSMPLSQDNPAVMTWNRMFNQNDLIKLAFRTGFRIELCDYVDSLNRDKSVSQRQYVFGLKKEK